MLGRSWEVDTVQPSKRKPRGGGPRQLPIGRVNSRKDTNGHMGLTQL